ncbi:MAG: cobalt/nickel transport system ATP-binding protein [Syntrophus sp. SKADARSKE-3]|nr:cobalt/nickel transport system ATP-binding protein [Syntrophus sp. SKADARSKE-3]
MANIIGIKNISYSYYGKIPALTGISLEIGAGDKLAVIGSNGTGKSTLLQIMAGLIHPSEGEVRFHDRIVSENSLKDASFLRFLRGRIGYIFQDSDIQLFCPTVWEELIFGPLQLGLSDEETEARACSILDMLEISHLKHRPSYMLSGGEKKRVAIGSVLTMNPDVLVLDEPTGGLDPRTKSFLMGLILTLHEAGKTIVIATHDLSLVSELGFRVAVISEEHAIERIGEADDILQDMALLLKVNLIHEHIHFHGKTAHSHVHAHYQVHRHQD